jgi:hypothetical protein
MPLPAFSFAIQAALPWGVALMALLLFQERHLPVDHGNHRDTQEFKSSWLNMLTTSIFNSKAGPLHRKE